MTAPEFTKVDRNLLADEYRVVGWSYATAPWQATSAALRAVAKARQQGREEGLREAANKIVHIGVDYATNSKSSREFNATVCCQKAILALIEKEPK